jgi:hypothetical protein
MRVLFENETCLSAMDVKFAELADSVGSEDAKWFYKFNECCVVHLYSDTDVELADELYVVCVSEDMAYDFLKRLYEDDKVSTLDFKTVNVLNPDKYDYDRLCQFAKVYGLSPVK